MRDDYRAWLVEQGYSDNTRATQTSLLQRLEAAYGPIDTLDAAGHEALGRDLAYSTADERAGRPNPSRMPITGNLRTGLASLRSGANLYPKFLDGGGEGLAEAASASATATGPAASVPAAEDRQRLALERDMQSALRRDLAAVDPGLRIIDDGVERAVATGFIDILAEDAADRLVVIELKAGKADARVIGQTLGYMGDLMDEDPERPVRGIIVAHGFDARTRAAARAVPSLSLFTYAITFSFRSDP